MNGELGSGTPALARSPGFIWGRAPSALITVGKGESYHFQERESGWSGFAHLLVAFTHSSRRTLVPQGRTWILA